MGASTVPTRAPAVTLLDQGLGRQAHPGQGSVKEGGFLAFWTKSLAEAGILP